jgi:hypothetical protein
VPPIKVISNQWEETFSLIGSVFLPRTPSKNPAELCFAYLKRHVRKWAPSEGYTQAGLEAAIRRALAQVTPVMVHRWIRACGHQQTPGPRRRPAREPAEMPAERPTERPAAGGRLTCASQEPLPAKGRVICADINGTVVKEKRPGKTEWHWLLDPESEDLQDIVPRRVHTPPPEVPPQGRWVGFGPAPTDVKETEPEVALLRPGVYEPERIVDERQQGDRREFRIRWMGYSAAEDTWEPLEDLLVGREVLLQDWQRKRQT